MAKSNSKRKTRSDKFPLTLHKTGQYCKKIKGKLYYFGSERTVALERYLKQATYLHSGKLPRSKCTDADMSIKALCNYYLDHQESRAEVGEIKLRHLHDQILLLRHFARFTGPNRLVSQISTIDLQNYRRRLIKAGKSANTINNRLAAVKAMFNWALDNEVVDTTPRLKAVKKISPSKTERPTLTVSQIRALLQNATPQMEAMLWLGLNCGFGCTDCAELKWKNLHLTNGRVSFPRGKTGITRDLPLWPETVNALQKISMSGEFVFYTRRGKPWVRAVRSIGKDGKEKILIKNSVSKEFSKLMEKTNIDLGKGAGFYTLRRTAATLAAGSGDPFAVQKLLGHADVKMASTYVQNISEQTDRVVKNSRKLIIQDDS
jgi:integrase